MREGCNTVSCHWGILFPWEGKRCGKKERFLLHRDTSHLDQATYPKWSWESYLNTAKLVWRCSELLQNSGGQLLWWFSLWMLPWQMQLWEGSQGWGFLASCCVQGWWKLTRHWTYWCRAALGLLEKPSFSVPLLGRKSWVPVHCCEWEWVRGEGGMTVTRI